MSLKSTIYQKTANALKRAGDARSAVYNPWVVQWEVTLKCNLKCKYCIVPLEPHHGQADKALEKLIKMRPKSVVLTGGEPLLLPDIVDIARKLREACRPYMMVTTNLIVKDERISGILPYLDQLHFSIDGLGDYNFANRGISGVKLVEKIEFAMSEVRRIHGPEFPVTALCVLTEDNYQNVEELRETIHGIDPGIRMTFATVEPITSPMSLIQHPEIVEELVPRLAAMQKEHNVSVVGALGNPTMRNNEGDVVVDTPAIDKKEKPYKCARQFFRVMMDPYGNVHTCKPNRFVDFGMDQAKIAFKQGKFFSAAKELAKTVDTTVVRPYKTDCPFPCKCDEYLDDIIYSKSGDPVPSTHFLLQGQFTEAELNEADAKIRKHFNKDWNPAVKAELAKRK